MGLFDKLLRKKGATPHKTSWHRELATVVPIKPSTLVVDIDSEPDLFHATDVGFALYLKEMKQGTTIRVGDKIPLACMFSAHWLTLNNEKIGYLFTSNFQVTNKGGYLLTHMNASAGKAQAVEVLVKTDTLVIYNFPGKGALIVSPKVGEDVSHIFAAQ